jgi:hypothetical protein
LFSKQAAVVTVLTSKSGGEEKRSGSSSILLYINVTRIQAYAFTDQVTS